MECQSVGSNHAVRFDSGDRDEHVSVFGSVHRHRRLALLPLLGHSPGRSPREERYPESQYAQSQVDHGNKDAPVGSDFPVPHEPEEHPYLGLIVRHGASSTKTSEPGPAISSTE